MSVPQPHPLRKEPVPLPVQPVPVKPITKQPIGPGKGLTLLLALLAVFVTGLLMWTMGNRGLNPQASSLQPSVMRSTAATWGTLDQTLRIGGSIETFDFAAIRTPKMRGPRDAGRSDMTLMSLAEAGTIVKAGDVVATFELKWLEDHMEDREADIVQAKAAYQVRTAEIMILKETERQARTNAKAEHQKSLLDLKRAEVQSAIEAEILKNVSDEAEINWKQLIEEGQIMEEVHRADLKHQELEVREEELHLERHERDYDNLSIQSPIDGMVVLEARYRGGGQFAQTKAGDRVHSGSLFMRIVDVSKMTLKAAVNQVDAQAMRIGNKAIVQLDAYPGESFRGRVTSIGAIATGGGGGSRYSHGSSSAFIKSIAVLVLIEDLDERILPDLSGSADVFISSSDEGLILPREALRTDPADGNSNHVYVMDKQSINLRNVSVKEFNDTHALVSYGVNDGEQVLLSQLPGDEDSHF